MKYIYFTSYKEKCIYYLCDSGYAFFRKKRYINHTEISKIVMEPVTITILWPFPDLCLQINHF